MGTKPKYIPWLFDNKEAFEKTVSDPRYYYDMVHTQFMAIYNEYRNGGVSVVSNQSAQANFNQASSQSFTQPVHKEKPSEAGQILTQAEIDALISMSA